MNTARTAEITRETKETKIRLSLSLDGTGESNISTGVGFFDHMLTAFAKHGLFDLQLHTQGDLEVDDHHTIEDTGLALGAALKQALGAKEGIRRYGNCLLPMDEALVQCALDLSGRPWLSLDADFRGERCGDMSTQMVREFFYALAQQSGMTLHLRVLDGRNDHHIIEAMFKA